MTAGAVATTTNVEALLRARQLRRAGVILPDPDQDGTSSATGDRAPRRGGQQRLYQPDEAGWTDRDAEVHRRRHEDGVVLHAPRRMYIVGDAVGGGCRCRARIRSEDGRQAGERGFLEARSRIPQRRGRGRHGDCLRDGHGAQQAVQGAGGPTLVVSDSALSAPNRITWDAANKRFIIIALRRCALAARLGAGRRR